MKNFRVYRDSGMVDSTSIDAFEKKMGCAFPSAYKSLLQKHNAVRLVDNCFDFLFRGKVDSRDVGFFGYGEAIQDYENIERFQQESEYCYNDIVVVGESANGDYICFDYRANPTTDNPPVVIMLHDYPDENNKMLVCPVADNFEKFIDSLYCDDE